MWLNKKRINNLSGCYFDIQKNAYEYEEWEVLLPMLLHKEFKTVDHLGITQDIAVWKDKSEI